MLDDQHLIKDYSIKWVNLKTHLSSWPDHFVGLSDFPFFDSMHARPVIWVTGSKLGHKVSCSFDFHHRGFSSVWVLRILESGLRPKANGCSRHSARRHYGNVGQIGIPPYYPRGVRHSGLSASAFPFRPSLLNIPCAAPVGVSHLFTFWFHCTEVVK